MCELGVFPIFLENDLLKLDKILGLTFFKARKAFEYFKTAFFHLLQLSSLLDGLFTTPVYWRRGSFKNSAFPNKTKFGPRIEVYLRQTNLKENVCRNSTFQVNRKKNAKGRRRLTSSNRAAIFVGTSCKERHNKPFWL